jgi:hypothetical protein
MRRTEYRVLRVLTVPSTGRPDCSAFKFVNARRATGGRYFANLKLAVTTLPSAKAALNCRHVPAHAEFVFQT